MSQMQWCVQLSAGHLIDLPKSLIEMAKRGPNKSATSFYFGELADFSDECTSSIVLPILPGTTANEALAISAEALSWLLMRSQDVFESDMLGDSVSLSFVNLQPSGYALLDDVGSTSFGMEVLPGVAVRIPQAVPTFLKGLTRFVALIRGATKFPASDPTNLLCDWASLTVATTRHEAILA